MTEKELETIINKIDRDDINKFLIEILNYNECFMNDFRSNFINYFPRISKSEYERKIYDAINRAGGSDNYIDYNETHDYTFAMYGFINESKKLLANKNYEASFDIIESILDSILNTSIDDSDGSTGEIANDCIEIIEDILGCSLIDGDKIAIRILNYLLEEVKTQNLYNYGIETYFLLNYFIDENKYIDEIKTALSSYIDIHKEDNHCWNINNYNKLLDKIMVNNE